MIIPFKDAYLPVPGLDTANSVDLKSLYEQSYIGNSLLNILGSYWTEHYTDIDNLHLLAGSVTALMGTEYQEVLQQVIASNIIDTPVNQKTPYQLFSFNSEDAVQVFSQEGDLEYIEFSYPGLEGVEFLSSGLMGSKVVLQNGEYFSIENGSIRFYVDIFNDSFIAENAYIYSASDVSIEPVKVVLLWATDVCMEETFLYDRYGRYLYTKQNNSLAYKATLLALQYFFVSTKSVKNLEVILNILFNLPFSKTSGEVVTALSVIDQDGVETTDPINFNANARAETQSGITGVGWFNKVVTTHNTYFAPVYADLLVEVGSVLTNYQLLCRVHRAKDYISDPDWYNDAKFPFELVEELDDYTVLDTPPEFAPYVPYHFDSSISYDGTSLYTGEYDVYNGINPFMATRSDAAGTEFEQLLYGMVDTVLKYNLLYIQTELNYDNIDYYQKNKISESYAAIAQGVPSYLYPIMEILFKFELIDQFKDTTEDLSASLQFDIDEDVNPLGTGPFYDGSIQFSNPMPYVYSGEYTYGSAEVVRFYPYGGGSANFYSAELEKDSIAINTLLGDDKCEVLGFDGVDSPLLKRVYDTYSGEFFADGSASYTDRLEDAEPLSIAITSLCEDTVTPLVEATSMGVVSDMEEYGVVGYTGEVGYNNTSPLTYGSLRGAVLLYDESQVWDGAVTFSGYEEIDNIVSYNGSDKYCGYTKVKYTYGNSLPVGIQVLDDLNVVWTQA